MQALFTMYNSLHAFVHTTELMSENGGLSACMFVSVSMSVHTCVQKGRALAAG